MMPFIPMDWVSLDTMLMLFLLVFMKRLMKAFDRQLPPIAPWIQGKCQFLAFWVILGMLWKKPLDTPDKEENYPNGELGGCH
jgi:hypothetical protein